MLAVNFLSFVPWKKKGKRKRKRKNIYFPFILKEPNKPKTIATWSISFCRKKKE